MTASLVAARPLEGRGIGLVALTPLAAGQLLFTEAPLLTLAQSTLSDLSTSSTRRDVSMIIARALSTLPREAQRDFLTLSNCHPTQPTPGRAEMPAMLGIWCTNGMTSTPGHSSVYPLLSRANHSCRPSAAYSPSPAVDGAMMRLRAVRGIEEGEEVTIAYCETTVEREERRSYLERQYGFRCVCEACEGEEEGWKKRGAELREVMKGWSSGRVDGQEAVDAGLGWLRLLVEHGRYTQRAVVWADLAQIASSHSCADLAKRFCTRAADAFDVEVGPDHESAFQHRQWAQKPQRHPKWAKRAKRELKGRDELTNQL